MAASWIIFIGMAALIAIGGSLARGPWVAGIALVIALVVWGATATLGAAGGRRADEAGINEPGQPGTERTPPAEPSH